MRTIKISTDENRQFRSLFNNLNFIVLIISGLLCGLIQVSTASPLIDSRADVTTTYSGAISSGPMYNRPDGYPDEYYYFHTIQITVSTAGVYTFTSRSNIDPVGYLYDSPFDPSNPSANLITDDDDSGDEYRQFHIEAYLQGGRTYVLVVTTHQELGTGHFSISAVGPASVNLMSITPSTSRPIITPSTAPTVLSVYSSALTTSSQAYHRPNSNQDDYYYFEALQFSVSTTGTYILTSNSTMDTMGFLYSPSFDSSDALTNLIVYNDDDGDIHRQFRIEVNLQSGQTYILVVTTHRDSITGSFSVSAGGPASLSFTSITPSTSQPIMTTTTDPMVSSDYSSALSSSSQVFVRPNSFTSNYYYFEAIQVTVSTAGSYVFKSNSTIDTMGYFYNSPFDPSNATANLIMSDDDSGGQRQFRFQVYLQAGQTYILVVTTHGANVTGNYSVSAVGPASVGLTFITPSTSRPIITSTTTLPIAASYAGELSTSSSIFYRPQSFTPNDYHYFQALQITVSTADTYVLRSHSGIDTRGYLYDSSFDPSNPSVNLIASDDDGGGNLQFRISIYLVPGRTYVLVVTTHRSYVTGNFSITASGLGSVTLTFFTPSTSQPVTPQPTTPSLQSLYEGELTPDSPIFYRPQSHTNNYHYFQAIEVTVPTAGSYVFRTNSTIDTRGYFYRDSFDPSNPSPNLIADNDDGGGNE